MFVWKWKRFWIFQWTYMVYITNCLCIQGNDIKFQVAACSTSLFPAFQLCQVKDVEGTVGEEGSWPDLVWARRPYQCTGHLGMQVSPAGLLGLPASAHQKPVWQRPGTPSCLTCSCEPAPAKLLSPILLLFLSRFCQYLSFTSWPVGLRDNSSWLCWCFQLALLSISCLFFDIYYCFLSGWLWFNLLLFSYFIE